MTSKLDTLECAILSLEERMQTLADELLARSVEGTSQELLSALREASNAAEAARAEWLRAIAIQLRKSADTLDPEIEVESAHGAP